jgi:hypothetical protein
MNWWLLIRSLILATGFHHLLAKLEMFAKLWVIRRLTNEEKVACPSCVGLGKLDPFTYSKLEIKEAFPTVRKGWDDFLVLYDGERCEFCCGNREVPKAWEIAYAIRFAGHTLVSRQSIKALRDELLKW